MYNNNFKLPRTFCIFKGIISSLLISNVHSLTDHVTKIEEHPRNSFSPSCAIYPTIENEYIMKCPQERKLQHK